MRGGPHAPTAQGICALTPLPYNAGMRHGQRRHDPQDASEQARLEREAAGLPALAENADYRATRAKVLATKKQRQAMATAKRKRDAQLKARGIDPERYTDPAMLALDEGASETLGVPSLREQLRGTGDDTQGK
jgi:hypothetical protein